MGFIALKCMGYGVWGRYGLSCQISCVPSWDPQEHMGYEGLSDIREMAYEGGDCTYHSFSLIPACDIYNFHLEITL